VVQYDSAAYGAGTNLGKALNLSLMVLNPANASGWLADGLKVINTTATVGGAISAAEALGHGDMGAALMFAAGSVVSMSRGTSACTKGMFAAALQRGMHVVQGIQDWSRRTRCSPRATSSAALLGLASAGVNAWRFGQACYEVGFHLKWTERRANRSSNSRATRNRRRLRFHSDAERE